MTTADIQTAVHAARKIDAPTHHDLWGRVMASRDSQRKLVDPNAHRHTFKTLIEATCTDCCCKECVCDEVADMNAEEPPYSPDCRRCEDVGCVHCR